jgi:hypothetical protein
MKPGFAKHRLALPIWMSQPVERRLLIILRNLITSIWLDRGNGGSLNKYTVIASQSAFNNWAPARLISWR